MFFQYLNLYSNWLNWWNNTVKIKNLSTEPLPTINKNSKLSEYSELVETNEGYNKKKLIIIGLITLTIIGIGYWYYYYSGNIGGGTAGNPPTFTHNPPVPPIPPVPSNTSSATIDAIHQVSLTDNQSTNNSLPTVNKNSKLSEYSDLELNNEGYNKKKLIIICLITFAVLGIGYWYY